MRLSLRELHGWLISSLRRRLLLWLLPATFMAGVLASIGTYWGAFLRLDDLLNDQMQYLAKHVDVENGNRISLTHIADLKQQQDADKADEILLQVWRAGKLEYTTNPDLVLSPPQHAGLADMQFNGQTWHTYSHWRDGRLIRVAQTKDARWEALAGLAVNLFWPVLSLLPLLALFLWFGIGYGLRPLRKISTELAQRDADSLSPIVINTLPNEIKPFAEELNLLLQRLDDTFSQQKHFIADAAHELRTPIMALGIQAQLLKDADTPNEREQALEQLQAGITRLSHLGQQLLTMARIDPALPSTGYQSVDLLQICKEVIKGKICFAELKDIDLGLIDSKQIQVDGNANLLGILLGNLVDNAIRYTPPHGQIDLAIRQTQAEILLEVSDTGPGIPEQERERVLERFYRGSHPGVEGSGLGLAIVSRIVEQHDARLELLTGSTGRGLMVRVRFPSAQRVHALHTNHHV